MKDDLVNKLLEEFGKGTFVFGQKTKREWITTGVPPADLAMTGGFPKGRIIEVYGPYSGGKTTICLKAIAQAQKLKDVRCMFLDIENTYDSEWAKQNGVDINNLITMDRDAWKASTNRDAITGEDIFNIIMKSLKAKGHTVIVLDSIAAVTTKDSLEKGYDEARRIGEQARLFSDALRDFTACNNNNITLIMINQIRSKIGSYGNPETTPGGNAPKFYASMRVQVTAKRFQDKDYQEVTVRVTKNKVGPPGKYATFTMDLKANVSNAEAYYEMARRSGDFWGTGMEKKGNSFFYNGEEIAKKKEEFLAYLQERPNLTKRLWEEVANFLDKESSESNKKENYRLQLIDALVKKGKILSEVEDFSIAELGDEFKKLGETLPEYKEGGITDGGKATTEKGKEKTQESETKKVIKENEKVTEKVSEETFNSI